MKAVSSTMNTPSFGSSSSSSRSSFARSSSSSSAALPPKYDVFLSFRGPDARRSFVAHLDAALRQNGVSTIIDERLKRGKDTRTEIRNAINHSQCSIVVFSENFADSEWCMDELVMIHERMIRESSSYTVFPVFYHVDSDHVHRLTGSYEEAFVKLREKFPIDKLKVSKCEVAAMEIANVSGWDLKNWNEHDLIQDIVQVILSHLKTPSDIIATEGASGVVNDQSPEETSNPRPQDAASGNLQSAQIGRHPGRRQHPVVLVVISLFIFVFVPVIYYIVLKTSWI